MNPIRKKAMARFDVVLLCLFCWCGGAMATGTWLIASQTSERSLLFVAAEGILIPLVLAWVVLRYRLFPSGRTQ